MESADSHMPESRLVLSTMVDTLAWNAAGTKLAVSFAQELLHKHLEYAMFTQVIDFSDGEKLILADNYHARHLFWLHDEPIEHLLLVSGFGGIRRYELAHGTLQDELDELDPNQWFAMAAASMDTIVRQLTLIMTPLDSTEGETNYQSAFIYQIDGLSLLEQYELPFRMSRVDSDAITSLEHAPASHRVATTHADGILRLWSDLKQPPVLTAAICPGQRLVCGAWSPDGTQVAVGSSDGQITVFDVEQSQIVQQIAGHTEPRGIFWHPDGRQLFAAGVIWDALTGSQLETVANWDAAAWNARGELYIGRRFTDDAGIRSLTDSILTAGGLVVASRREPMRT